VEGNGIFVDGDSGTIEPYFGGAASDPSGVNFYEKKMIVGASGDDVKAVFGDCGCEGFGVFRDLLLVFRESWLHRFFQANRFCSNGVDKRAPLDAGESELVEFFCERGFAEDQAAAWAAKSFVRGGADEIGVRHGAGVNTGSDESCNVGHVHEE